MSAEDKSGLPSGRDFGVLGYLFVAGFEIAVPAMIGVWLDGEFGTRPWCGIAGAVLGLVACTLHLYRVGNRQNRPPK